MIYQIEMNCFCLLGKTLNNIYIYNDFLRHWLTLLVGAVALTNVSVAALFYKKTQIPVFEKAGICGKI